MPLPPIPVPPGPAKRCLIIGPTYPAPWTLQSTANDIPLWFNALSLYRGVASFRGMQGNISRAPVMAALTAFVIGLKPGDKGIVILLGHGSWIPGDEPDGRHEVWVMSDLSYIQDDELGAILAPVASDVTLDVVAEFCYAGGSTDNLAVRSWEACGPDQISWGVTFLGTMYSLFSFYLCQDLRNFPSKTAQEIIASVGANVMALKPDQVPQLEGSNLGSVPF